MAKKASDYKEILQVLGVVFIEIRATENIKKVRVLADIVHNAPSQIAIKKPENDIVEDIMFRAKRHNIEKTFLHYFELAKKR